MAGVEGKEGAMMMESEGVRGVSECRETTSEGLEIERGEKDGEKKIG